MKYNGKTRQEIVNRIWEKTNDGVGKFDLKYLQLFFVEAVLGAAEEVFAEMQPAPVKLKKGDIVTHNLNPKWGKGTVGWISKSGKQAEVHFEQGGWGKPLVKNLTKVEASE